MQLTMTDNNTVYTEIMSQFQDFLVQRDIFDNWTDCILKTTLDSSILYIQHTAECVIQQYFDARGIEGFVYIDDDNKERSFIKVVFQQV